MPFSHGGNVSTFTLFILLLNNTKSQSLLPHFIAIFTFFYSILPKMSELCLSSSTKSANISNIILSDLILIIVFIHSHPLYFCYIIFFSPYLFKLLAYLSPLFITTSLLLLGLLTVYPQPKGGFFLSAYKALREKLGSKIDTENDKFSHFEDSELYKVVFDTSSYHQIENSDYNKSQIPDMGLFEGLDLTLDEKTVEVDWEESAKPVMKEKFFEEILECARQVIEKKDSTEFIERAKPIIEENDFEEFLEPLEEFEDMSCSVDEKKIDLLSVNLEKLDVKKEVLPNGMESEEIESKTKGDNIVKLGPFWDSPSSRGLDSSLRSYGSMRREKEGREKEWTRTLACKLFEERNRSDGEDGMDLLWEKYENDLNKKAKKSKSNMKNNKGRDRNDFEVCYELDGDEDEVVGAKICCLQALKFSTGKMNLGMKGSNIVKISKAIKGFGWLHNMTRHTKRGYTSNFK